MSGNKTPCAIARKWDFTFEDFPVGAEYELGSRSLSQDEIVAFARDYDPQPFHTDPVAAKSSAFGTLIAAYLTWVKLVEGEAIGNRPLLLLSILLIFSGLQLLTLGLLAELQSRTYHESQDKPIYVIRQVLESAPSWPEAASR